MHCGQVLPFAWGFLQQYSLNLFTVDVWSLSELRHDSKRRERDGDDDVPLTWRQGNGYVPVRVLGSLTSSNYVSRKSHRRLLRPKPANNALTCE